MTMRSFWIIMVLKPMSEVFIREREGDSDAEETFNVEEATRRQRLRLERCGYELRAKLGRGKGRFFP